MNPFVSVIILNWNGLHHLNLCLSSLAAQSYPNFEVILLDNGSIDGSVAFVQERFPDVRLICLDKNVGFAAGNNVAIRASEAPFIATLNNDTKVEPNWLTELVKAAEDRPKVGMWASKMLFYDRPHIINSTGICLDRVAIAWDREGGRIDEQESQSPVEIFGASAGAALYRRAMLDEVSVSPAMMPFDEHYFAYLEDVDLAWRARLAGWQALYVPTAVVYHHHSATSIEGSPFKSRLLGRNKIWTIFKNYPWPALLYFLPLIIAYDLGSVAVALLQRRDINPLVGRLMSLPQLGAVWRKRVQIQRQRQISQALSSNGKATLFEWMEPVTTPMTVMSRYRHLQKSSHDD